jgi:hypothetical protein
MLGGLLSQMNSLVRRFAILVACLVAGWLVLAVPAGAKDVVTVHSLHQVEELILGPDHAAEHADERAGVAKATRAWRALSASQRRRVVKAQNAELRKLAHSAATFDPTIYGSWGSPFRIPVHAIHMGLLPTGKVIFYAFPFYPEVKPPAGPTDAPVAGDAWLWDPTKGDPSSSTAVNPDTESMFTHVLPLYDPETGGTASLFCSGLSLLPNGDLLVTGGTLEFPNPNAPNHLGLKRAYTFNPWTESWIQQPDMQHGRWYPSQVELNDGRTAVLAGEDETTGADNAQLQVFNPTQDASGVGTWTYYSQGDRETDLYPHMTLLGNGNILLGGPGPNDSAVLNTNTMTWSSNIPGNGARRTYGTELLNPNGTGPSESVTELGGFPDDLSVPNGNFPPVTSSQTLDLSVSAPQWTSGPTTLNVARANFQSLWLPDGSELSIGGGDGRVNGSLYELQNGKPEHQIEIRPAGSNNWMLGPSQQIDRAYHSTALLLPDGRVLSAGDDNPYIFDQPYEGSDNNSGEIYSPAYLFRGTRPVITSAPNGTLYGAGFHVGVGAVNPSTTHAMLIPPAEVTHATNDNPRIVPLQSVPNGDGLDLTAPASANIAPPGWYMLWVVTSDGVPSVATWIHVGYPSTGSAVSGGGPQTGGGTLGSNPGAPKPRVKSAAESVKTTSRQSFKKGRFVTLIALSSNKSTVTLSAYLQRAGAKGSAKRLPLLGKLVKRGLRAGTAKITLQLNKKARKKLLAAKRAHVLLKIQVKAPGAPTYNGSKRISNKR